MVKAVDIAKELEGRPVLKDRSEANEADAAAAFAELGRMGNAGVFAGSFSGQSPWERHRHGDELVQILAGATTLTLMTDDGPERLEMRAGMLTVVPQGTWHRFHAPDGVTVMTATPQPTDHSFADDPRDDG